MVDLNKIQVVVNKSSCFGISFDSSQIIDDGTPLYYLLYLNKFIGR